MHFKAASTAVAFLYCAVLTAQDSTSPAIHVTTRLVQVGVVVHDKEGHPVAGLRKEDFTLLENGREQTIALFSADFELVKPSASAPLPKGVYTNQALSKPGPLSVILFDASNTQFADRAYARQQMMQFIRRIQPGSRVAIYVLQGGGVGVLHDFTDDPDQLARAFASYSVSAYTSLEPGLEPLTAGNDFIDKIFPQSGQAIAAYDRRVQALSVFKYLEDIAHHLAVLSGRKSLIWVTGFPWSFSLSVGDPLYEDALRATRVLTDANVALYPVDARGLMVDPLFAASGFIPSFKASGTASEDALMTSQLTKIFAPTGHDVMHFFADETGGRALIDRNDIDTAIEVAIDDARETYTLGFYSPDKDWDGKFHELKVKVNRPGIEMRYRKGFVALADPVPDVQNLKAEVSNVLASAIEATAIEISADVALVHPGKPVVLDLTLRVAADNVHFSQENGQNLASLELVFAQLGADGSRLIISRQPLALNISQSTYEEFIRNGIFLTKTVDLVENAEVLKVVAVDSSTGRIGSLRIPLESR